MSLPMITTFTNLAFIIIVAVAVGSYSLIATRRDPRWKLLLITLGVSIPFFVAVGYYVCRIMPRLVAVKLDEFAYCADKMFGEPSYHVGQFLATHHHIRMTALIAYLSLQGVLSVLGCAYILSARYDEGVSFLRVLLLNFFLATPFCLAFPIAGPAHAFAGFPWNIPAISVPHAVYFYGIPNGMPSVHTSTALLILYYARRWKIGTVLASLYLVLIVLSTLGFGEHYIIDLFAAVPYTAGVLWLEHKLAHRNPVQNLDATLGEMTWQRSQQ